MPAILYPPWRFLVLICVRGWFNTRAILQLEGLGQLKNPVTSLEIKLATFYDSRVNVLSLLLPITGHFLLYSVHRKSCTKYISYIAMWHQIPATENAVLTSGAAHLEELWTMFRAVEPGLGSHVHGNALDGRGSWSPGMIPYILLHRVMNRERKNSSKCAVGQTWWQCRRPYPLQKGWTRLLGVQKVTPWSDWFLNTSETRGGFKLSPEVYEHLLPPMHKLKENIIWHSTYCYVQVTGHHHTDRFLLLAYFPYFEEIKAGLWDCLAVCVSPLIFSFFMWSMSHHREAGS
jgi:hypothetical protein